MNVSPLDLRQQRFRKAFRGFDPVEVTLVPGRRGRRLRAGAARNRPAAPGSRADGGVLSRASRAREEPAEHADGGAEAGRRHQGERRRARRSGSSARRRAASDLLLEKTQARLEDVQREIDGLKLKRKDVETSIEATIQTLRNTLEFVREQEAREREEKILLHRPRPALSGRASSVEGLAVEKPTRSKRRQRGASKAFLIGDRRGRRNRCARDSPRRQDRMRRDPRRRAPDSRRRAAS